MMDGIAAQSAEPPAAFSLETGSPVSTTCKVCGAPAIEKFRLPRSKLTGLAIPELPNDCCYYECTECLFCFTRLLDGVRHETLYDEEYWSHQDPDWFGRVSQAMRLVLLGNKLIRKPPDRLEVLDFGCGPNTFVHTCRQGLNLAAWGTDIIKPKFAPEYFLPTVERQFDMVIACEVLEHLPDPVETFRQIRAMVRPGGVFAFQTACWEPERVGRDWWYIGPGNGHISFYSRKTLDRLYRMFGGKRRLSWRRYPGVQAWQVWDGGLSGAGMRLRSWSGFPM